MLNKLKTISMKFRIISILKICFPVLLLTGFQQSVFSQGGDSIRGKGTGLYIGLSAGPSISRITNEGITSESEIISNKINSFFGSVEVGYNFTNFIGLFTGIGYIPFTTELTPVAYQAKFNTIDTENEAYEKRIFGTSMKEVQKINCLTVPICLNIRLPLSKAIGFFLQTGVNLAFPITTNYTSSGIFSYKAYYSKYNLLLENIPAYGFPSNKSTNVKGELNLKQFNVLGIASAGFDYFVRQKIQLAVEFCYNKSLSDISAYTSQDKFMLSTEVDKVNSFMGASSKVSVQSMGVNISLRYYLR